MLWLITADWQIAFENLAYSKLALVQELSIIKKYKIDCHIDLGDQKDAYNPIDGRVSDFARNRANAIYNALPSNAMCIRLLGNHDRYGQYNDSNNWMSMFDLIGGHNVSDPKVIGCGDTSFFCLPYRKQEVDTINAAKYLYKKLRKSGTKRNVLLFHNDVRGTRYDNVQDKKSTCGITLAKLYASSYDMCFGGHIHKRQWIAKNAMFVGNPFATDMGEIDQRKGFILYDDVKNTVKFIPSKIPGLFSWSYAQKHFKKLPEGTRIKEIVRCSVKEDYHKKLNEVCDAIEKKFPLCIPYVIPKFAVKEDESEVVVDPNASDYFKIKSYIAATVPKELKLHRNHLVEYLAAVLARVEGKSVSRHTGKLIFDSVTAKNVLTFASVKFNYRNQGVVLVKGNNKDVTKFNSIGSGKSNLLSLPSIALFGQTFKQQKNDAWASDLNENKAHVSLTMHNDMGSAVEIIRSRRPGKLKMIVNAKDESTGLRSVGKMETQGQIEQFIGYTFDTFYKSVYIDQSLSNAFLNGTPKQRSDLIHQFQNLERFEIAKKIVSKEMGLLQQRRTIIETEMDITSTHLLELKEDIQQRSSVKVENVSLLKKKYLSAKKLFEKNTRSNAIRIQRYKSRIEMLDKAKEKISRKEASSSSTLVQVDNAIDSLQSEIKNIQALKECKVCLRPVLKKHRHNIVETLSKKLEAAKVQSSTALENRIAYRKEFILLQKDLRYLSERLNTFENSNSKLAHYVSTAKSAYDAVKDSSDKEQVSITKAKQRYVKTKVELHAKKKTLAYYAEDRKFLEYALNAFSRDGLPAFLSNMVIPVLNKAAERYSKLFIDGEIQVIFDLEKGQIVPRIINAHGGKSLQAQSTGEKAWAGIITSFALREISHPTNLLILDEPGHGLDSESAKTFGKNLLKLKSLFETVLVVTHDPSISSALEGENTVTVVKSNKISTLK